MKRKFILIITTITIPLILGGFLLSLKFKNELLVAYKNNRSISIKDRNNENIFIKPNHLGYYAEYSDEVPAQFKKLLIKKEDKYFYYHLGINPVSSLRAFYNFLTGKKNLASSTITQQLVKILLQNELDRNLKNKVTETIYAISMETHTNKEEILKMYVNSIYLGNKIQGIDNASRLYFESTPALLDKEQNLQLLATLSSPSTRHPFATNNAASSKLLCEKLNENCKKIKPLTKKEIIEKRVKFNNYAKSDSYFELDSLKIDCEKNCALTVDKELSENLREILKRNLLLMNEKDVTNGSVVVIKLPENEILSVIGSPDPKISSYGYQINMAKKTRPIGSAVKPFIYLKGFEKGLRPYTIVEDKEYKYTIGTGFSFYPKNYDYEYRGEVNLHYSLTNSLNVPTVKVLEYAGLDDFYSFLLEDLEFNPVQDIENYQLGIALGGLEMDLLSLSYYFTIFPSEGKLNPLKIYRNKNDFSYSLNTNFLQNKKIADEKYIQLINKVLSDRKTGIEQFGMNSNLNLFQDNYAVKTGTSREFHDSWTIGYTPDFLVGVWVGNSDNTPMNGISGQSGAGKIWNEAMNLLINSEYNKKTPFEFDLIQEFYESENIEYGLFEDDYEENKNLLQDNSLILNPHNGDIFLLEENTQILLRAKKEVWWYVNNKFFGEEKEIILDIENSGIYKIKALDENSKEEVVKIFVKEEE
ncbi:transglycosylase domain-containing protein [Candidatus Parcubacteria bacterium]|nr:transglycosylase domain-containing protein [Candidatus Parcubacteria bacterium]